MNLELPADIDWQHWANRWDRMQERYLGRQAEGHADAEDWKSFWENFTRALGTPDRTQITRRVLGGWEGGVEQGLPLTWHLEQLRRCGFRSVDCLWRCAGDAIYGGIQAAPNRGSD